MASSAATAAIRDVLDKRTRPGTLVQPLADGALRCVACGHRCVIQPGKWGVCRVRFNRDGTLYVPWGYVGSLACDPIEKKPFFHALPGSKALSFGMLGCDFHCGYCQNWITSQTLRDPRAQAPVQDGTPEDIVNLALRYGAPVIASTYNEPLITSEWAVAVLKLAKQHGIIGAYVSNGNATPEVLEFIRPYVDLYKVDLKSFRDKAYRELGGTLDAVLDTIRRLKQMDFWVEVVTLVVPTFNDSDDELRQIADFVASVSVDIPWHVTAFHQDYKMTGPPSTPVETLLRAVEIGRAAGLHYVYAGNRPGQLKDTESTFCHNCKALLIQRTGFFVQRNHLDGNACPKCKTVIPGRWTKQDKYILAN